MKRWILAVIFGLLPGSLAFAVDPPSSVTTIVLPPNSNPEGIAVNPVTHKAYVAAEDETIGKAVLVFDNSVLNAGATIEPLTKIPIPNESEHLAVDPLRNLIYVSTKFGSFDAPEEPGEGGPKPVIEALGTLTVIDGNTDTVIATWTFAKGVEPEGVAVDVVDSVVYIGTKAPEGELPNNDGCYPWAVQIPDVGEPEDVECWTAGSIYAFFVDRWASSKITLLKTIPAGDDPEALAFVDGKVYAANEDDGTVTIATEVNPDGTGGDLVTDLPRPPTQPYAAGVPPYSLGVFYPYGPNPLACKENKFEADKMAAGDGSVFITDDRSRVAKITGDAVVAMKEAPGATVCLEIPNTDGGGANSANNVAFMRSRGLLYVVSEQNTVAVFNPETMEVSGMITIPDALHLDAIGVDGAANLVWITDEDRSAVFVLQGACADGTGACLPGPLPPVINSEDATTFNVGSAGSFTVMTVASPTATLSFTGELPAGVIFDASAYGTATLAGTPGEGTEGTYALTITATNGLSPDATQNFTLTVDPPLIAPAITSASATTFTVGLPGSFTVTATGSPTPTLFRTGPLPAGVTFTDNSDGTANLAGTPGAVGSYPLTITASSGEEAVTQIFTLTVLTVNGKKRAPDDYDGDGKADLTLWSGSDGSWQVLKSGVGGDATYKQWGSGALGDVPLPGDYDGDGKTDFAIWRQSQGIWYVLRSGTGYDYATAFVRQWSSGAENDVPVPADYDGDGRTDFATWRPSDGAWYVLPSGSGYAYGSAIVKQWGSDGDTPVPGDYDGDGRTDFAVWRPSEGVWLVLTSSSGYDYASAIYIQWGSGALGDMPVPADYDGDGRTDFAIWRPSQGSWYVLTSKSNYDYAAAFIRVWGDKDDVPVVSDYDGDGSADLAVWRPSVGMWYVLTSTTDYSYAGALVWQWGGVGDKAVREQSVRTATPATP